MDYSLYVGREISRNPITLSKLSTILSSQGWSGIVFITFLLFHPKLNIMKLLNNYLIYSEVCDYLVVVANATYRRNSIREGSIFGEMRKCWIFIIAKKSTSPNV
jgi:hypothetical protein